MFSFTVDVYFSGALLNCFSTQRSFCHCWQSLEVVSLEGSPWTVLVDIFSCSEQTNCGGVETVL